MGLGAILPAIYKGMGRELAPAAQREAVHSALLQLGDLHGQEFLEQIPRISVRDDMDSSAAYARPSRNIYLSQGTVEDPDRWAILRALSHETQHLRDDLGGTHFSESIPYWLKPTEEAAYTQSALDLAEIGAREQNQPFLFDELGKRQLAESRILPWMRTKAEETWMNPSHYPLSWQSLRPAPDQMRLPFEP